MFVVVFVFIFFFVFLFSGSSGGRETRSGVPRGRGGHPGIASPGWSGWSCWSGWNGRSGWRGYGWKSMSRRNGGRR